MDDWLLAARARIAQTVGEDASAYDLSDDDVQTLLSLSGDAAHDSVRTNAPLVSYLAGLAVGRSGAVSLADVAAAARGFRPDSTG